MRRFNRLLAALFICVSIALVDSYFSAEAALIVSVAGVPKITKSSNNEVRTCKTGMEVNPGDVISTLLDERVDIALDDKADRILRIDENSYVRINTQDFINLSRGTIYAKIKSMPKDSKFEVRTPVAICGARGTGWFVETDSNKSAFGVFENSIYVKGIDRSGNIIEDELSLTEGQKTLIDRFDKPGAIEKLSEADLNKWNDLIKELEPNDIKQRPKPTIEQREELNIDLDKQAELLQTKLDKMNKIDAMETRIGVVGEGALTGPGGASGRSMLGPDDDKKERDGSQLETINR